MSCVFAIGDLTSWRFRETYVHHGVVCSSGSPRDGLPLVVPQLKSLDPHEQPHLLGLNVNAGQAIKHRLRTDRYDGFRLYSEVHQLPVSYIEAAWASGPASPLCARTGRR